MTTPVTHRMSRSLHASLCAPSICLASMAPQFEADADDPAGIGREVHQACERIVRGQQINLDDLSPQAAPLAWRFWRIWHEGLEGSGVGPLRNYFPPENLVAEHEVCDPISGDLGHLDFASYSDSWFIVCDIKTGRTEQTTAALPQLESYGFAFNETIPFPRPRGFLVLCDLRHGVVDIYERTRQQLREALSRLHRNREWAATATANDLKDHRHYVEGSHCATCPGAGYCPVKQYALARMAKLSGAESVLTLSVKSGEDIAKIRANIKLLDKMIEAYKEAERIEVTVRGGRIDLGDGTSLVIRDKETRVADPAKSLAILQGQGHLPSATAWSTMEFHIYTAEEAIKQRVRDKYKGQKMPQGAIKQAIDAFRDDLAAADAITKRVTKECRPISNTKLEAITASAPVEQVEATPAPKQIEMEVESA